MTLFVSVKFHHYVRHYRKGLPINKAGRGSQLWLPDGHQAMVYTNTL